MSVLCRNSAPTYNRHKSSVEPPMVRTTVWLRQPDVEALKQVAARENRTFSGELRNLIQRRLADVELEQAA